MNLIISKKKVILQKLKISPNVAVYVEHRTLLGESLIWQILCQPLVYSFSRCLLKFLVSGQTNVKYTINTSTSQLGLVHSSPMLW